MSSSKVSVSWSVNSTAELVAQDAGSYQNLLEEVDRLQAVEAIRSGLEDVKEGRTVSLESFDKEMRAKHGISD